MWLVVTRSGLVFADRYRLDERIAAGGVGQVWLAKDLLLERTVAVKVLRPEFADHAETLDRFRAEAQHTGAVSHPHVAQVHDYGHSAPDGSPYLVLEYIDGSSLAELIAIDPVDTVRALDIVAQAADGLAAAHQAGLVHRDVKPANILIRRDGLVKVTDFGIAHVAGQAPVTRPGMVMGTTQYMAPERIAGSRATPASDLYALGIVLHECLTGVPPHDGSAAEVMAAQLYLPLPPLPVGTPQEVEDLVARLTVKDPGQRLSDAHELAERAGALRDSLRAAVPQARAAACSEPPSVAPSVARAAGADAGTRTPVPAVAFVPAASSASPPSDGHGGPTAPRRNLPLPGPGRPGRVSERRRLRRRRKTGALAAGAAALASAGIVALLVSGAFNPAPAGNHAPAGPVTAVPGRTPSLSPSAPAGTGKAGRAPGGAASAPAARHPTPSAGSRPRAAASTAPATAPATSAPASKPPAATPGSAPPTTSPSPSHLPVCVLGVCI